MRKKKVFIHSDFSLAKTGFGRAMKALCQYLYNTGKYEIVHYCCGTNYSNPILQKTPWKSIGCLPDSQQEMDAINRDPNLQRDAGYGGYLIDKVISEEKPDFYIGAQDIWAFPNYHNRFWWNKIHCAIWTTLDSLPILPTAVECADKVKNYWIWSDFATKALHEIGHKHVKTVHGPLEDSFFKKFHSSKRRELRNKHKIEHNAFIIGFVFRNQLRKSVPNLLEGFSIFKKANPSAKAKLLLHTSYSEGWNIMKLAGEYKIDKNDILTTYICRACNEYEVRPFEGEERNCKCCNAQKSCFTTNVLKGVSEEQLNEIYNLMDVYCHPFTSGGQEIPIQEAKLCELITLVTNYSCGEELCQEGSGSLPLDWAEYREHGTEFRKASTLPSSIAKQLNKVYSLEDSKKIALGKMSREWAIQHYSVASVGKIFENYIDSLECTGFDFKKDFLDKNPNAQVKKDVSDNKEWLKHIYLEILKMDVKDDDSGLLYWMQKIQEGVSRDEIENYFRSVAHQENLKNKPKDITDFVNKNDKKRVLCILPESIGDIFMATSLFESIRDRYPRPEWAFYFCCKPEYFEILEGNPHLDGAIPYVPEMDNLLSLEGAGNNLGHFEVVYPLHFPTQRMLSYLHNGVDKIDFNLI